MLTLALLLALQEGDTFIIPEELQGVDPPGQEQEAPMSAVPS